MFSSKIMTTLSLSLLTSISTITLSASENISINRKRAQDVAIASAVGFAVGIAATALYFHFTNRSFIVYKDYSVTEEVMMEVLNRNKFDRVEIGVRSWSFRKWLDL